MKYRSMFIIMVLALFCLSVQAQEKRISAKELPAAVRAAFEKSYPNAQIKGTAREVEKGVTYYEIESVDGTTHRDLLYEKDGKVFEIEETLDANALPQTVKAALEKAYPGSKVRKAEKTTHDSTTVIEVLLEAGKKRHEIVFDVNGQITKDNVMKAKKENKEEKEEK